MICIEAEKRVKTGSYAAQRDRKQHKIPSVFYGKNVENINLLVDPKQIVKLKRQRNSIVMLLKFGDEEKEVIIKDIQIHPVTMLPLHVDFLAVDQQEMVKVNVLINYTNSDKCVGIKQGGHLNKIYRRIPLLCLPKDIPGSIEINTIDFNIGKIVKISDIKLSESVQHMKNENIVVCNIIGRASKQTVEDAEDSSSEQPPKE